MQPAQSVSPTQVTVDTAIFFELSLDLLCVISVEGYFKRVNPAFGKTLGYSDDQLIDQRLLDFVHPEDQAMTTAAIAHLQSVLTSSFENRYRCQDGSYKLLAWTIQAISATSCIYAIARDLSVQCRDRQELQQQIQQQTTELENTTAALQDSEILYRTLAQNLPKAAVYLFDRDLRYLLCEGKEMIKVGLSKAMLEGKTLREVFAAEICAELEPIYRATLAGEEVVKEIPYRDRIYAVHTVPVRNEHGEIFAGMVLTQNIDERKRTRAALLQSEETIRRQLAEIESIYATAPIGLCFLDTNLRYVRVNEHLAEINGIPASEHIGKTVYEILPELAEVQAQIFAQVIKTGLPVLNIDVHGTTPAKPGVERDWLVSYYPLHESDDQVLGINIMVQEITYRKQAAAALQEREKQLTTILSNTPDVICRYNKEFRYIYISPAAERVTRIPPADFIGKTNRELGLAEDAIALWENALREVFATKQEKFIEFTYQYFSGTRCYYSSLMPEFAADGSVETVLVISRDITERKQTEEALRESELNYRTLADTMPQLFWTTLPDGYHEYYNQRWYDYTGLSLEQTQGTGWNDVLHPDDQQRSWKVWNESLCTGKDYEIEYRFRRADGEYRWFLGRAFPLRDADGKIIRWFGSCTDIHDQKIALEQRDRAVERERAARAQAEAANRIKDEFLAVLSHELRSPLNPILGWAKLLQSRKFDENTTRKALQTIERNAQLQTRLIEDLLDVSRILQGKLSLNVSPLNLATTIEAALETVRLAAEAKSIQMQVLITSNVRVSGDAARLQQVVWNLLTNAVKFTPSGGRVTIRLALVDFAQIQVIDTGKGIAPEFLPHVFDYFRQADSSITRTFGGLGLGLAIVRHLVELHGGTVTADSPGEGQGATFTVKLPLPQANLSAPTAIEYNNDTNAPLTGIEILAIDDEADMRELLVFTLEQYGAKVTSAITATEVLEKLATTKFDIIICDIGMPHVDGYTLIRQVRTLFTQNQLPAIALTAYAGEADQQQALAAGFDRHLAKPVEPSKLLAIVASLVKK